LSPDGQVEGSQPDGRVWDALLPAGRVARTSADHAVPAWHQDESDTRRQVLHGNRQTMSLRALPRSGGKHVRVPGVLGTEDAKLQCSSGHAVAPVEGASSAVLHTSVGNSLSAERATGLRALALAEMAEARSIVRTSSVGEPNRSCGRLASPLRSARQTGSGTWSRGGTGTGSSTCCIRTPIAVSAGTVGARRASRRQRSPANTRRSAHRLVPRARARAPCTVGCLRSCQSVSQASTPRRVRATPKSAR